jgi:hypothetical protein
VSSSFASEPYNTVAGSARNQVASNGPPKSADVATITAWLKTLVEPGSVVELRIPNAEINDRWTTTVAGYFDYDHLEDMARVSVDLSGHAQGVYYTINPVVKGQLAACPNTFTMKCPKGGLTNDDHITKRHVLPLDIDPYRREDGFQLSSAMSTTKEEKRAGLAVVKAICKFLHERKWPLPLIVDSGNGFYLLYRIDLPREDDGLVERCLKVLASRFNNEAVHIDESVYNPSRILKIPGTMACKGGDTPERPHRVSSLLTDGSNWRVVPRSLLEVLAAEYVAPKITDLAHSRLRGNRADKLDLPQLDKRVERARAYVAKMEPSISGQGGHKQLFKVAMVLGDGFGLPEEAALELLREFNERGDPESEEQLAHKVASAMKRIAKQGGPSYALALTPQQKAAAAATKPQIVVDSKDADRGYLEARRKTLRAFRLYNRRPRLFQRSGALVRLTTGDTERELIEELNVASLNGIMMEAAEYGTVVHQKHAAPTTRWDMPNERLVKDILHLGWWPAKAVPRIRRVVPTPRFTSTGKLICKKGFDRESGIYLSPPSGSQLPTVPEVPTDADVQWAKDFIFKELYYDFPFVRFEQYKNVDERADDAVFYHNSSRCHLLAFMLQPFLMEFIDEATPLYNAEAPTQGTGKTRALRYATLPSQGTLVSTLSPPETEEEWNKTILTQLRYGAEYALFDNLDSHLSSRSFANVLTAPQFQGRLLGTNTLGIYPNKIAWAISVNNGSFSPDIARRTVLIRLDAGLAAPDQRDPSLFKHSILEEWARQHASELLRACLILCQRWVAAGMPRPLARFDYPQWAGVMGGLLQAIGMRGFLENRGQVRSHDDVKWIKLIQRWLRHLEAEDMALSDPLNTNTLYELIMAHEGSGLMVEFAGLGRRSDATHDDYRHKNLRDWMVGIRDRVFAVPVGAGERNLRVRVDTDGHYKYWLEDMHVYKHC